MLDPTLPDADSNTLFVDPPDPFELRDLDAEYVSSPENADYDAQARALLRGLYRGDGERPIPTSWNPPVSHSSLYYPDGLDGVGLRADPGPDPGSAPEKPLVPQFHYPKGIHKAMQTQVFSELSRWHYGDGGESPDDLPLLKPELLATATRPAYADLALARSPGKGHHSPSPQRNLSAERHALMVDGRVFAKALRAIRLDGELGAYLYIDQYQFLCWCIVHGWNPAAFEADEGLDLLHARVPRPSKQKGERAQKTAYRELAERYEINSFLAKPYLRPQADNNERRRHELAWRERMKRPSGKKDIEAAAGFANAQSRIAAINELEKTDRPLAHELVRFFLASATRSPEPPSSTQRLITGDPFRFPRP